MATVWDAARALLATTGTEEAAIAAAREIEAFCRQSSETDEAAFWLAVADAVAWECNPQPLIAPVLERGPGRGPRSRRPVRPGIELPMHRSTVLRFRRDLRELWERYRPTSEQARHPKDDRET